MMADELATLKIYTNQWNDCFVSFEPETEMREHLRNLAFDGKLRGCNFRSVCWRVFLDCLSSDVNTWESTVKSSRKEYQRIKDSYICNPNSNDGKKDLSVENPLSQNDESSWNQHFKDMDLRMTIERDVRRTFPEMEYFHNDKVHLMLVDILFCYACEHSKLSYRQGMHELLAPLVFIIHCDLQAACSARERGNLPNLIDLVLQETYLEHDSYDMFCHVMKSTNNWYSVTGKEGEDLVPSARHDSITDEKPFQPRSMPSGMTLAINEKLHQIYDVMLADRDLQLHTHLSKLEIIPQVFGLRWIRLLFGREFPLQDLLVLWDAMFADSSNLDLVDYIFVAMLIHVREKLLDSDYSACLQLLMKFPPVDDVNDIVQAAKRIRQESSCSDSGRKDSNTAGRIVNPGKPTATSPTSTGRQNSFVKVLRDITRRISPGQSLLSPQNHFNEATKGGHAKSSPQTLQRLAHGHEISKHDSVPDSPHINRQMVNRQMLENPGDNRILRQKLDERTVMHNYCAKKLDSCINMLQSSIAQQTGNCNAKAAGSENDCVEEQDCDGNQVLVAVATLKQVRDILQGTVKFDPSLPEYKSKSNGAI